MTRTRRIAPDTRPEQQGASRRARRSSAEADWGEADPALLTALVAAVSKQGGAVRFGYTSDGGAYAIGFYGDGDPYTEYVRPGEGLNAALTEFITNWA